MEGLADSEQITIDYERKWLKAEKELVKSLELRLEELAKPTFNRTKSSSSSVEGLEDTNARQQEEIETLTKSYDAAREWMDNAVAQDGM